MIKPERTKNSQHLLLLSFILAFCSISLIVLEGPQFVSILGGIFSLSAVLLWIIYFPDVLLMVLISLCFDVFGLYPVLQELRLPWAYGATPPDLILVLVLFAILTKSFRIRPGEAWWLDYRYLLNLNWVIVIYVIFLTIYSSFITGRSPLNYAMRIGEGHFLYYSTFMYAMLFIDKQRHVKNLINFIRVAGILVALFSICSNITQRPITNAVCSAQYGSILRVGVPGYAFSLFVILFGYINYVRKSKEIQIFLLEIATNLVGFLLYLARMWIISLCLMLIISLTYLRKGVTKGATVATLFAGVIALVAICISPDIVSNLTTDISERFTSGYQEFRSGTSSMNIRFSQIRMGYELFRETPIWGTGFIREGSPYWENKIAPYGYAVTYCADYGLFSILYTTGLIGFSLITVFIILAIKEMMHIFHKSKNVFVKNLALGACVIVGVDYFVTQFAGNCFGTKQVTFYLLLIALSLKSYSIFESGENRTQGFHPI